MPGNNNLYNTISPILKKSGPNTWELPTSVKVKKDGVWTEVATIKKRYNNTWVSAPTNPLAATLSNTQWSYKSASNDSLNVSSTQTFGTGRGLTVVRDDTYGYLVIVGYYNNLTGNPNHKTYLEAYRPDGTRHWIKQYNGTNYVNGSGQVVQDPIGVVSDMTFGLNNTEFATTRHWETSSNNYGQVITTYNLDGTVKKVTPTSGDYSGRTISMCASSTPSASSYWMINDAGEVWNSSGTKVYTIPGVTPGGSSVPKVILDNGNTVLLSDGIWVGGATGQKRTATIGTCMLHVLGKYYIASGRNVYVYNDTDTLLTTRIATFTLNLGQSKIANMVYDGFGGLFLSDDAQLWKMNIFTGAELMSRNMGYYINRIAIANWNDIWLTCDDGYIYRLKQQ